jgi:hypothetical protein
LRRSTLRGNKASPSSSPITEFESEEAPPPLLVARPRDPENASRSKRLRTSTIPAQEFIYKRRRLSNAQAEIPALRIPLRSRGGAPNIPAVPPPVTAPSLTKPPFTSSTPIPSPSGKPQYEQIKIIEQKAKASIRGGDPQKQEDDRRKLRSKDGGSRAKTELAQYFPDFEEMLSLKPVEPGRHFWSCYT